MVVCVAEAVVVCVYFIYKRCLQCIDVEGVVTLGGR